MPERLALLFGPPRPGPRPRPSGGGRAKLQIPDRGSQGARRDPEFQRITDALEAQRLKLSTTPEALEPETILVLEIAGEVTEFARAMTQIRGLEFLGEQALDQLEPDDEFAAIDQKG